MGKVKGKVRRWITISLLGVSLWEGCTHPPGANTLPISCRGTAKLFHMNPLIPLQCLQGFCSSTHTHTHAQAQAPRLHLEAIQGWKMLPKGWLAPEHTSAWEQVVHTEIIWQLRHVAGRR